MKKIVFLGILFLWILTVACSNKGQEPPTYGKIQGTVYNAASGLPLDKALVTTSPPTYAVTTDTLGAYLIENVEAGTYHVRASKTGYDSAGVNISVLAGFTTTADIPLKADSSSAELF